MKTVFYTGKKPSNRFVDDYVRTECEIDKTEPIRLKKIVVRQGRRSGCYSSFFKLSSRKGMKVFDDKEAADDASKTQAAFAKGKYAPKVLSEVFVLVRRQEVCFAYITQLAKVAYDLKRTVMDRFQRKLEAFCEKVERFLDKTLRDNPLLRYAKSLFGDDHEGNWGLLNGRMVWIDFSY